MSITIGVDYHKRTSSYCVLDSDGNIVRRCTLDNNKDAIKKLLTSFTEPVSLAMEATRSWALYYDFVAKYVNEFKLGHPRKMKLITECEIKNDKRDAQVIAEMNFHHYLPQAYVSDPQIRDVRDLVRYRGTLVEQRRSLKNQVYALIDRNVWIEDRPTSFKDLFCKRGMTWLETVELNAKQRFILSELLAVYTSTLKAIAQVEGYIALQREQFPTMKFIRTVPGFRSGGINAIVALSEIADINRFSKMKSFIRYVGLIPREHSSAGKIIKGRLVKEANMHLRTALIESTLAAIRIDSGLKAYYKSVKKRCGSSAAVIATARKLATALYFVLKEQRPYRPHSFVDPSVAACHASLDS